MHGPHTRSLVLIAGALLLLAIPAVRAQPAAAQTSSQTVSVSGVVTDASTGRPIAGADVIALGVGTNLGGVKTDGDGYFERQLVPGRYSFTLFAAGFYAQSLPGALAHIEDATVEVTAAGPNRLDAAMLPDTRPYIGTDTPTMKWTHAPHKPFESMVLDMRYGAYAAVPPSWPADTLAVQLVDTKGTILRHYDNDIAANGGGGSGGGFSAGSTTGCDYFGNSKQHPDVLRLSVKAFLRSRPDQVTTTPMVIDRSQCSQTKLKGFHLSIGDPRNMALIHVDVLNRAPAGQGIAGTVTLNINNRRKIAVRVKAGGNSITKNLGRPLHFGKNTVRVSFAPADPFFSAPVPRLLHVNVPRHRHK